VFKDVKFLIFFFSVYVSCHNFMLIYIETVAVVCQLTHSCLLFLFLSYQLKLYRPYL